jgi:ABC-type nitrate/sulfonate/bicarbonate transport system substrate-binding protein
MAVSRRHAVLGAAAMLLAARASVVWAQTLTTIRYGSTPLVDGVPLYYAQQSGMFRSEGLDVAISKISNSSAIAAALVG